MKRLLLLLPILAGLASAQTTQLTPFFRQQFFDANGKAASGFKVCSYQAGTSTPLNTYTDQTGATPNANPVILDSAGQAPIWLINRAYKLVLRTAGSDNTCSTGTVVETVDNVNPFYRYTGTAAPVSGTYQTGDFVWNTTPASNGILGWINTAGGSPGTWVAEGGSTLNAVSVGVAIASAATIAPTAPITHVTGTTQITTITAPAAFAVSGFGGCLTLIPDGLWSLGTGGNIGVSVVAVVSQPLPLCYDNATSTWYPVYSSGLSYSRGINFIGTETGGTNAIAGCITGLPITTGLQVTVFLAHTLQAGANTFNYCTHGTDPLRSHRNNANNIGTAYAGGLVSLIWDGSTWEDVSQ